MIVILRRYPWCRWHVDYSSPFKGFVRSSHKGRHLKDMEVNTTSLNEKNFDINIFMKGRRPKKNESKKGV